MRFRNGSVAVVAALVAGCSLTAALDGLSQGEVGDVSPLVEAGSNAIDARDEADVADGGQSDGGSSPDPAWCQDAFVCDDFEREGGLGPWDRTRISDGSAVEITDLHARSGTRSVHYMMGPEADVSAHLHKSLPLEVKAVTYRYSLFVETSGVVRNSSVSTLRYRDGQREVEHFVFVDGEFQTVNFVEQEYTSDPPYVATLIHAPLVRGRWADISVTLDRSATPWRATFTYDGITLLNEFPLTRAVPLTAPAAVEMGISWAAAGARATIAMDDVRVEVTR